MHFLVALGLSVLILKGTKRLGSHFLVVEGLRLVAAAAVAAVAAAAAAAVADAPPWYYLIDLRIPGVTAAGRGCSISSK